MKSKIQNYNCNLKFKINNNKLEIYKIRIYKIRIYKIRICKINKIIVIIKI